MQMQRPAPVAMSAMGGAPPARAVHEGAVGDPMIDGLLTYPSLLVKQKLHGCCKELCCENENRYKVYNPTNGQKEHILTAVEDSACCCRFCLGTSRSFQMSVVTGDEREVVHFDRPYRVGRRGGACFCCCDACFQRINVFTGAHCAQPNVRVGCVREEFSFCVPVITVRDENEAEIYRIIGHLCGCFNYSLEIFPAGGKSGDQPLGRITKTWAGAYKELFTDADNFYVEFPTAATGKQRMLLMGALFLIDYLYFERKSGWSVSSS
eukprot:m51a1_g14468 hypothetical protein (265) ;mRNA; f:672613-673690